MKKLTRALALGLASSVLFAGAAIAEDFHGFDPATYDGAMLSGDQLKAMVADAMKVSPPKNGKNYVVGFANLQRDIPFGIIVEKGIQANADAAGLKLEIADNRLDGPTALANAQSFAQRNVDFVIEFQTDSNFGPQVMKVFNDAKVKVVAIDIPMPGATFFGANNPKSGFMGGSYLATAAIAKFGADKVKTGYFVDGELPQSGAIPAMRTNGQIAGFKSVIPGLPDAQIIKFDSKNTMQESFTQMGNVLGRIPAGVPIMATGINDQVALGILRAVKQAGREADLIDVGNGADETKALSEEPNLVAATGYFPERYGNFLIPVALATLAGKTLPPAVLMSHVMLTKSNVCKYYKDFKCSEEKPKVDYTFPQAAFETFLGSLASEPALKGYETLIPKN
ncbi:MAG: sugar transporter substrate-binding protein [Hyphomicrobiales bacterium]|nr:sugar transporter substrate-binding protein [Hyphomicrobiales bacterium]